MRHRIHTFREHGHRLGRRPFWLRLFFLVVLGSHSCLAADGPHWIDVLFCWVSLENQETQGLTCSIFFLQANALAFANACTNKIRLNTQMLSSPSVKDMFIKRLLKLYYSYYSARCLNSVTWLIRLNWSDACFWVLYWHIIILDLTLICLKGC